MVKNSQLNYAVALFLQNQGITTVDKSHYDNTAIEDYLIDVIGEDYTDKLVQAIQKELRYVAAGNPVEITNTEGKTATIWEPISFNDYDKDKHVRCSWVGYKPKDWVKCLNGVSKFISKKESKPSLSASMLQTQGLCNSITSVTSATIKISYLEGLLYTLLTISRYKIASVVTTSKPSGTDIQAYYIIPEISIVDTLDLVWYIYSYHLNSDIQSLLYTSKFYDSTTKSKTLPKPTACGNTFTKYNIKSVESINTTLLFSLIECLDLFEYLGDEKYACFYEKLKLCKWRIYGTDKYSFVTNYSKIATYYSNLPISQRDLERVIKRIEYYCYDKRDGKDYKNITLRDLHMFLNTNNQNYYNKLITAMIEKCVDKEFKLNALDIDSFIEFNYICNMNMNRDLLIQAFEYADSLDNALWHYVKNKYRETYASLSDKERNEKLYERKKSEIYAIRSILRKAKNGTELHANLSYFLPTESKIVINDFATKVILGEIDVKVASNLIMTGLIRKK